MASNGFVLGFGFEGLGIISAFGFSASDLRILIFKCPHFGFQIPLAGIEDTAGHVC